MTTQHDSGGGENEGVPYNKYFLELTPTTLKTKKLNASQQACLAGAYIVEQRAQHMDNNFA